MPNETQDNLKTLHRNLLKEGFEIPTDYSKFQTDMRDDSNIKKLWGNLKSEYDLPEFDKFKSDMGMDGPKAPLIKGNVEEAMLGGAFKKSKDDASEAIDRSIDLYNRAYNLNPNSPESKSKKKQYEEGLASGDFSVISGPSGRLKLARKATAGEAYTNSLKSSTKSYNESKNLKDMSNDDAIKYIKDKFGKEEVMPLVTEGILPKITETLGGFSRLAAKQGAGALALQSGALLLAPETGGLSLAALGFLGGVAGAGDELSTQEYGGNLIKYYMQGEAEGLKPKDAIEKARTQAERASKVGYAEAVGYELAGKAVGRLFPKNVTGEGVKAAVGKYFLHAAPEVVGAATVAGGSSLAKDLSAKELGYKVSNKEMFDNAWNEASDIGKFMLATTALHGVANGATKMPNYVKSQLKNYVTSAQEGLGEKVLNNLKNAGVLKADDVEKTLGTLKDFNKAKKDIKPLNVEDETVQGSLAGKQEKKNKLKSEIEELNKNGVKVGIKKKQAEIDKLDKEMEAIHETGDVDKHEHDQDFGINARVEDTKGKKKLFIDDLEVTPEEFEYVTGKKPEDYPTKTIEPTKKVKSNAKEKNKTAKEIGIKLKSIDEKNIQPIPEGYFNTPEKQDLLNKFKNETITDAEIDKSMELLTDDEFIYIDKNFMQYPPEIEEAIAQIVPEMMANKYKDVTRGVEDIKLTINNGVKDGKISSDSAKIASVLLDKRPDLFTNLGVLLSPKEEGISTLGQYDPINKIIEIFDGNKNSTTLAHELLHHTEKFFPDNIKYAIREEWLSSIDKEIKDLNKSISKGNLNEKELNTSKKAIEYLNIVKDNNNMFQGIDELDVNKYLKQRNDLYNYFRGENGLSSKYYNLFDVSEWWANNSVDLLEKYANAKDKALIDKIKDFYKELIESIRQFVNPSKAKEVENALNNLLKGSYDKESSTNLSEARFESVKKSIEEPKYTQTEEQKSVDEEAKNMGFEMPKKEVSSTAKVELTDKQKQSNIDKATAKQRAEAINQTEQEYGSTTDKGVPTGETTGVSGDVSSEPTSKIESTKSTTTEQYTHTDAGFKDEPEARAAYDARGDKDVNQTYEEFLYSKACGDF